MSNKKAQERVRRYYLTSKEYFNKTKNIYKGKLKPGELVLV
jgi:hypothetical protein